MKKALLLLIAATMATANVTAQNGYDTKNEVVVSYGFLSSSRWISVYQAALTIWTGGMVDNFSFVGPFNAEYFYHANEWFSVGGIFSFGYSNMGVVKNTDNSPLGTINNKYFAVLPAVKFDWFRGKHVGMYSKVGVGAMLINSNAVPANPAEMPESANAVTLVFQATAFGVEFGGTQFRGFVEAGVGEQGSFLAGLRYKF